MGRYTLHRLLSLIPVLIGISLITFSSMRLVPGGPAEGILGTDYNATSAAAINRQLGLDRPLIVQFISWFGGLFQGNLGSSVLNGVPVSTEIAQHFPYTFWLTAAALAISVTLAVPLGVLAARHQGSPFDFTARTSAVFGVSIPSFVAGVILILIFAVQWRIFPAGGTAPPGSGLGEQLRYLVLPAISLSGGTFAITLKMVRTTFLETAGQDHVRTARAKGIGDWPVARRHILRNSLLPVVTVVGIQVGYLLGGAIVVEGVFAWPGMGTLLISAVQSRDYPTVQGAVLVIAVVFVFVNLLADLLMMALDPRLRHD